MKILNISLGVLVAIFCLPAAGLANWDDNFDSYGSGTLISGQGGWEEWSAGADAYVTSARSQSPPNSLDIAPTTDIVRPYFGYTHGHVIYKAWVYIPGASYAGESHFIMLNTYNTGGPYEWAVQFYFNSADGLIHGTFGSNADITTPYVTDAWGEIRLEISLEEDWVRIFYNNTLIDDPALPDHPSLGGGYRWTGGNSGGGGHALNVGAVDLYGNNATEIFYDDMSLQWTPGPPLVDVKVNGQDHLIFIPSGSNVKITIDVVARGGAGKAVDLWVVLRTPFGFFSYDGSGPYVGWNMGLNNPAHTGPLFDLNATVLDRPLPNGTYKAYLGIDSVPDGQLTLSAIQVRDEADFFVM